MTYFRRLVLVSVVLFPSTSLADWDGGYGGLTFGTTTETEASLGSITVDADDTTTLGLFGGFQLQAGEIVFGGEAAFTSISDVTISSLPGGDISGDLDVFDLKGRLGYDLGQFMPYGVIGYAWIDDAADEFAGWSFGFGADYAISENFIIGAEYLARRTEFDDNNDLELDLDTLSIRAALTF